MRIAPPFNSHVKERTCPPGRAMLRCRMFWNCPLLLAMAVPLVTLAEPPPAAQVPEAPAAPVAIASTNAAAVAAAVGKTTTVRGKVTRANAWAGGITFLNLEGRFTVLCFKKNLSKFPSPPEKIYQNKIIEVTGQVRMHKDKPEIEISSPDQVKVLGDAPPTAAAPEPEPKDKPPGQPEPKEK